MLLQWLQFRSARNTGGGVFSHRNIVLSERTKTSAWKQTLTSFHSVNNRKEKRQGR